MGGWTAHIDYDDEYQYDQYDAVDGLGARSDFVYSGYDGGYYPEGQYTMVGSPNGNAMAMQTALVGVIGVLMCIVFAVAICIIGGVSGFVFGYVMGRKPVG